MFLLVMILFPVRVRPWRRSALSPRRPALIFSEYPLKSNCLVEIPGVARGRRPGGALPSTRESGVETPDQGLFRISSAAFSPTRIDGALVLPEGIVGKIEASATRTP